MPRALSPKEPNEAAVVLRMKEFLAAEKVLSVPVNWEPDGRNLRFTAPLDIGDVTEAGMLLFGRASVALPDRNVTLGLSWSDPEGRGGNFDRLDWRPIDTHTPTRALGRWNSGSF